MRKPKERKKPKLILTLEQQEADNCSKLAAAAVKDDFDFSKHKSGLIRERKKRGILKRRTKASLFALLRDCYLLVLAIHRKSSVRKAFIEYCKGENIKFKNVTSVAYRVVIAFITKDPQRASDYGKAIRGAILKGQSPKKMESNLLSGVESLKTLQQAVDVLPAERRPGVGSAVSQKAAGAESSKVVLSTSSGLGNGSLQQTVRPPDDWRVHLSKRARASIVSNPSGTRFAILAVDPKKKSIDVTFVTDVVDLTKRKNQV